MTLILMLASEDQVHMTCDFKLTDARTGNPLSFDAHKLVPVAQGSLQAVIGVTGLATLDGDNIGTWIAKRTSKLGFDSNLDSLFTVLREASEALARVPANVRRFRHLTFAIGAIQGSQVVVALLSNFQALRGNFLADGAVPGSDLRLDVARPSKPRLVLAGQIRSVRKEERRALEYLIRSGTAPDEIRERMAAVNRKAAARTQFVSEGCYAASEFTTGKGETQPFLVEQVGEFMPPDVEQMLANAGLKLNPKILPDGSRAPLRLVGATSTRYSPSPSFFREQFKLRPDDSELWNNFGAYEVDNGRVDVGRSAYERAIELDPQNFIAARNLGFLLWRTYGDRESGRRWVDIALQNPDENHRRETLSLLADALLFSDGDVQTAGRLYEESIQGDPLTASLARWGYYILHFEPMRHDEAERRIAALVQQEPHYGLATLVKAEFLWLIHGDVSGARAVVENLLAVTPKDVMLIALAVQLCVVAGELEKAVGLLRQLTRIEGSNSELVLSFSGLICLCRGGSIAESEELFRQAGGDANTVNIASLMWAQARDVEARNMLESIDQAKLSIDTKTELRVVLALASAKDHKAAAAAVRKLEDSTSFWDPTVLRCLSVHPEVVEERKALLRLLLAEGCEATASD